MHLTSVEHGVLGSYAIVGAHLPIAAGAAWSAQLRGTGQVAVCFFGDGTTNIGAFHEALNLAAVWKLPVVFVCENNLYMEYTPIGDGDRGRAPGGRPRRGLRPRADPDRRQRRRRRATRPRERRSTRARSGDGPVADRGRDLPPRRPLARRPGQLPAGRRRCRRWLEKDPMPRYRAAAAGRTASTRPTLDRDRDARLAREVEAAIDEARKRCPSRMRPATDTDVWATGARHGGTDLPRRGRRGDRPGDGARPDGRVPRRGHRRGRRRVQGDAPACSSEFGPSACGTRRSPSRRSSARRWAPR